MPEQDRFERSFRDGWRGAYRIARGGAPPAEVADKLVAALAKTLRETGGVPGLRQLEQVGESVPWRLTTQSRGIEEETAVRMAFTRIDRIVRDMSGHRNAMVAANTAKSLLAQPGAEPNSGGFWPPRTQFVERTCLALMDHYFFASARANFVAEGKFRDHTEARQWQHAVEAATLPTLRKLAERLQKTPSGTALRAPNRSVRQQSTKELLGMGLISTQGTPNPSPDKRER